MAASVTHTVAMEPSSSGRRPTRSTTRIPTTVPKALVPAGKRLHYDANQIGHRRPATSAQCHQGFHAGSVEHRLMAFEDRVQQTVAPTEVVVDRTAVALPGSLELILL